MSRTVAVVQGLEPAALPATNAAAPEPTPPGDAVRLSAGRTTRGTRQPKRRGASDRIDRAGPIFHGTSCTPSDYSEFPLFPAVFFLTALSLVAPRTGATVPPELQTGEAPQPVAPLAPRRLCGAGGAGLSLEGIDINDRCFLPQGLDDFVDRFALSLGGQLRLD
jgi:hypothetical protein